MKTTKTRAHRDGWDDAGEKFYVNGQVVTEVAETNHREKAANLYQALTRVRILARLLNNLDLCAPHEQVAIAEDVDALSYAIREIADKITSENEA